MLFEHQYPYNCSMVIAVLGGPNAGKSTLINCYMGMDLSIVTNRPHTTRNQLKCVTLIDHTEFIFIDTPGVHLSHKELNKRMNGQAREAVQKADMNLLLLDLTSDLLPQYLAIKEHFTGSWKKTWLLFNKSDQAQDPQIRAQILPLFKQFQKWIPQIEKYFVISATNDENIHELTSALLNEAPNRPHQFRKGEVSNKSERFFATEYIRKEAFEILHEEVPYELAVQIDEYKRASKEEGPISLISATIIVNRPSQRAIVIGSKGNNIKIIGTNARKKIEEMTRERVHLNLHVKVTSKWFTNNRILESLGLPRVEESKRLWKQR